ncbi:asc-type amino acid transporter 1 isoform X1 [Meles meles]|uniref:asc-type amino acid transporter 1 isoform X1 n=1 Tax=Meles meles TaxID=9662 RepID=UPI001E6A0A3F|nr:asc-type amino acid transporter 1 isoform X1 [Meles meles]
MAGHTQQPSGRGNPGPAPSPSPGPGPGPGPSERVALKKEIGLVSACTIIIGNIIGSGIFISPKGVLEHSGSVGLALFVWVLGGGVTALGSLCYAELGVAIPKSGGDYAYVTEIFGGLAGFLLLWSAVLIMYPTSLAVISMTFSNYVLQPVFPNCIPPATASRALSMACLMLLTWVNSSSVRWATRIQDIFTGGKLLALSLIIGVGFVQIFQGHFEELRPSNAFDFWMTPSVGHLALAFLQGSFAFSGWNFLNYVTEELVDPRKNLPRAIVISIPLVTFVYTFTNIAYFTAMSPQELLVSNAVAVTFGEKLLGYFSWVMPVSVALSTFGGINGYLFTSSRLCFSGAREGHLPSLLAMIHVRHCTPIPALLVCCGATAVIMLVGDTYTLINYVSFINYLCYGVTILGLLVLRWRRPALHRPIKVNLLVPVAYLVFWAFLLVFSFISEPMVCGVGMIIILTGVPVFFLGVFWRSKPKCVHRLTGCPRGGGKWPLPAAPTARHGQAFEDTVRHSRSPKQLFLFTCCLLRKCFCKIIFFFWIFVLFCFVLSWKKRERERERVRSDTWRPRLREPCRCGLGSRSALPHWLLLQRSMNKTGLVGGVLVSGESPVASLGGARVVLAAGGAPAGSGGGLWCLGAPPPELDTSSLPCGVRSQPCPKGTPGSGDTSPGPTGPAQGSATQEGLGFSVGTAFCFCFFP